MTTQTKEPSGRGALIVTLAAIAALISVGMAAQLNDASTSHPQRAVAANRPEPVTQVKDHTRAGATHHEPRRAGTVSGNEVSNDGVTVVLQCRDRDSSRKMSPKATTSGSHSRAKEVADECTTSTSSGSPLFLGSSHLTPACTSQTTTKTLDPRPWRGSPSGASPELAITAP
jgi:hypothetical protein